MMSLQDKKQTILITGASGLVGSYTTRYLVQSGYTNVRILLRPSSKTDLLKDVIDHIEIFETTLTDVIGLSDAIQGCHTIIHCGAFVSFDPRDKRQMAKSNIEGTANIVNLCLEHQIQRLIHISSIAALGRNLHENSIHEDVKWESNASNSFYALTKHLGEMEVWRGHAEGLNTYVLAPGIILGSGFWDVGSNGFLKHVWRQSPFYPPGSTGFVDVRDIAVFIACLLEQEPIHNKFILVSENWSYKRLFDTIADVLNKKQPAIQAKKWILETAWRLDLARSFVLNSRPLLTKETALTSLHNYTFDNSRALSIDNFAFRPVETTVREIAQQYLEASNQNFKPMFLKFDL